VFSFVAAFFAMTIYYQPFVWLLRINDQYDIFFRKYWKCIRIYTVWEGKAKKRESSALMQGHIELTAAHFNVQAQVLVQDEIKTK